MPPGVRRPRRIGEQSVEHDDRHGATGRVDSPEITTGTASAGASYAAVPPPLMEARWLLGAALGRYRLEELLGQGGTAAVYRADDPAFERAVAIKVLHPALARDPQFAARFLREARAMARLHHPNIIPVHDVGEQDALPFLVMQYSEGGTIRERLRAGPLSAAATLALLRPIAGALDYAHERGIIHRDVKPGNILLAADGSPVLTDFGIAKVLEESSPRTQTLNMVLGTVEYMAPEQGQGLPVDGRADLYSLGVILYEALTGRPPFQADTPMSIIVRHATTAPPAPRKLNPGIGVELNTVLLRALAKRPDDRYPTGAALFAALDAALAADSVPAQRVMRAFKGQQTFPAAPSVTNAGLSSSPRSPAVAPVASDDPPSRRLWAPLTSAYPRRSRGLPNAIRIAGAVVLAALLTAGLLAVPFADRDVGRTAIPTSAASVPQALVPVTPVNAEEPVATATDTIASAPPLAAPPTAIPAATATPTPPMALRGQTAAVLSGHARPVTFAAWSPDNRILASASDDGTVRLWTVDGQSAGMLSGHRGPIKHLSWSPTGRTLATASYDGTARLWRPDGSEIATLTGHTELLTRVVWSPSNTVLATASADRTIRLWESDGRLRAVLRGHEGSVEDLAWSPDGKLLASGGKDRTIRLWGADGQLRSTLAGHTDTVWMVAWSPNGQALASAGGDTTLRLWDAGGAEIATLRGHTALVTKLAWSPDGLTLASGGWDQTVRLWTMEGRAHGELVGHTDRLHSLAWSPDGTTLASGAEDRTVRLWGAAGQPLAVLQGHGDTVETLVWSADSHILASGSDDATVRLWH